MVSTPRVPRRLRFGLFGLAALFFANPNVANIDILPDAIGYLLLWAGLYYGADLHGRLAEAREGFLRMAFIDAAKIVSFFFLVTVASRDEQPTMQLLFTFVFSVLEIIYALPAWRNFFDGLDGLISDKGNLRRYDLISRGRGGKIRRTRSLPELLRRATTAWLIWRAALATLPEMTALSAFEHSGYVTNFDRDIYEFHGLFVFLAVCIMFVIGFIWLIRMLRFVHRLHGDTDMLDSLREQYAETVLVDEGLFLCRRSRAALLFCTLGALFSVDFYVEELNVIPDFIAVLLFAIAVLILFRCSIRPQISLILLGVWGGASVFATWCERYFHGSFYPGLVYKNAEAYTRFQLMCTATVIEQIAFAAAMVGIFLLIGGFCRRISTDLRADIGHTLTVWLVLAAFSAVSGAVYDFLLPSTSIWLIDMAIGLIFAFYSWKGFADITEAISLAVGERIPHRERKEY